MRGAFAGQALSIERPASRCACRARSGTQRFFADAGITRNRRSASGPRRARRNRLGQERGRVTSAPASTSDQLRPSPAVVARLRSRGGKSCPRPRSGTLAVGTDSAPARFSAYYGKWLSCSARGELGLARQTAERFLREAKVEGRMVEAAVASRNLGLTCFWQGEKHCFAILGDVGRPTFPANEEEENS